MDRRLMEKKMKRQRRKFHIRKRVFGTPEMPRLTVFKSNRYIYAQVIDDRKGETLASISNLEKELKGIKTKVADALKLGELLGQRLKEKNILAVVFDRNGYKYHGIIKSLADGARKAGIKF